MECVCVGGEGSEKLFSSIWCGLMYFFDEWGQPREFGDLQEIAGVIKYISTPESSIHGRSYGRGSQEEDSCTASSVGHETCNRGFSAYPERTCLHKEGIVVRRDMWVLVAALAYEFGRKHGEREDEIDMLACYLLWLMGY